MQKTEKTDAFGQVFDGITSSRVIRRGADVPSNASRFHNHRVAFAISFIPAADNNDQREPRFSSSRIPELVAEMLRNA
jgi:hypothetical protein